MEENIKINSDINNWRSILRIIFFELGFNIILAPPYLIIFSVLIFWAFGGIWMSLSVGLNGFPRLGETITSALVVIIFTVPYFLINFAFSSLIFSKYYPGIKIYKILVIYLFLFMFMFSLIAIKTHLNFGLENFNGD